MYQSGWEAELTSAGSNGPYSQIGLIWASPPRAASSPATSSMSPIDLKAKLGHTASPTTLSSVRPFPANWVCLWRTTRNRCAPMSAAMIAGSSRMWIT